MAAINLRCLRPQTGQTNEDTSIRQYMQQLLTDYNTLRTTPEKSHCQLQFWDLVAISSRDEEQKTAFELQIEDKLSGNELPKIPYVVFNDPENIKIGNGGSTLHVLEQLHAQFGDALFEMRTLLIHAGGTSQRLPTASILGKLFTPLPIGDPVYQMLDLKLAIYLPFLKRMAPGVMVTCSDDIETYWLDDNDNDSSESVWSFEERGFIALSHKGDVETGTQHGVYVLPFANFDVDAAITFGECLQVLQKPSVETMDLKAAIINGFGVCTDSVFYFSQDIIRKFLDFYKSAKPIDCEIDAYNDFLQALGINANMDYIHNPRNKLTASKSLTHLRQKLYLLLHKTSLNVLLLHWSRFYHLGTSKEYINNLTNPVQKNSKNLFHDLGFANWKCNKVTQCPECTSNGDVPVTLTVVQSIVETVEASGPGVIEYCNFKTSLTLGEYCLLSYCTVRSTVPIVVPARTCMQTVPVKDTKSAGYVTVAFGVDDDLKVGFSTFETNDLLYFDKKVSEVLVHLGVKNVLELFDERVETCSLWNAKIFVLKDSETESFVATLRMVLSVRGESEPIKKLPSVLDDEDVVPVRLSMTDVIRMGDVTAMLQMRKKLRREITNWQD